MKKYFFYIAAVTSISISACRKIEVDGEPIIVTIPGTGGGTTGKTVTLSNHITKDTTLLAIDNNNISGLVYVDAGVTLTVQAGATVKGAYAGTNTAALIVNRGGKLVAKGTQEKPIIFTSASPTPTSGDWGGIELLGKAAINSSNGGAPGLYIPEGGFSVNNAAKDGYAGSGDALVPTPINDDSSGVLQYVRIEYAGYAFLPNQEINSLTMACVGSKTVIDHIQVSYAKDDAFEWFGGTVNCKYLIAYKTQDDDFDTDNGFSGSVQFGLIVRDSSIADVSKSESFESDNDGSGSALLPQTKAVFSNISSFGPLATPENVGNSNYLGAAVQIRRNSSLSIFNSAFVGWSTGILIDASSGTHTDLNITAGTLQLSGILLISCKTPLSYTSGGTPTYDLPTLTNWFTANTKNKIINQTAAQNTYTRPFDYISPDFGPFGNSAVVIPAATNTYFDDPIITARPFITKVDFIGGIAPSGANASWYKGWTSFGK